MTTTAFDERRTITNTKALLMILVVFGHFLQLIPSWEGIREGVILWIYSFHMPAFVFVSGYLSKNAEKRRSKAFEDIFIPFILFQLLFGLINIAFSGSSVVFSNLLYPEWAMWYLLALFVWRYSLPAVTKIRGVLWIAAAVSILTGYLNGVSNAFAAQRTFGYFVFFLMGYYCKKETIQKVCSIRPLIARTVLTAELAGSLWLIKSKVIDFGQWWSIFSHQTVYNPSVPWMMAVNYLIALVIGTVNTFLLISAAVKKESGFLTQIGNGTMAIYLSHACVYFFARKYITLLQGRNKLITAVILGIAITSILLFSRKWYTKAFGCFLNGCKKIIIRPDKTEQNAQI